VTDRLDRLFDEVDRQLGEVQEQAHGIATRAGLLVTITGVAAAVLVANIDKIQDGEMLAFVALGLATVAGVFAILPTLERGPTPAALTGWAKGHAKTAVEELFKSKIMQLDGNRQRLALMTWAFYLQVVMVLAAVVIALVVAARR
jgi:hypothetical protein